MAEKQYQRFDDDDDDDDDDDVKELTIEDDKDR